ncbi:MAG: hypothetical protein NZ750_09740 [Anaerolineae bacterium]|nr:hypothetical protein [Anaerolineae bacterium]MDW8171902.1 hypothetical protein [Anaerolineae bacterium]
MAEQKPGPEAEAVDLLRLGASVKNISARLQRRGMSKAQADELAWRVWRDNLVIRRTNSLILLVVGLLVAGLGLLALSATGPDPFSLFFVVMGSLIFVRGLAQRWAIIRQQQEDASS